VEIEFKDKRLAMVEHGEASDYVASGIPLEIIEPFRKKLNFLRGAPDERSLRVWKSLHYEKLKGNMGGERSIRLNNKWRLILNVDESQTPPKLILLRIEDYH
jgi:toxin HigB-1